jgi:hypothetical protein
MAQEVVEIGETGDCEPCSCYYERVIVGSFTCELGGESPYQYISSIIMSGDIMEQVRCGAMGSLCHEGESYNSHTETGDCGPFGGIFSCDCTRRLQVVQQRNLGPCPCPDCPNTIRMSASSHLFEWHFDTSQDGSVTPNWPLDDDDNPMTDPNDVWRWFKFWVLGWLKKPSLPLNCDFACEDDDVITPEGKDGIQILKAMNAIAISMSEKEDEEIKNNKNLTTNLAGIKGLAGKVVINKKEETKVTRTPFNGPWKMRDTDKTIKQYYKDDIVTWAGKTYKVIQDVKAKHPSNTPSSFLLIEDPNAQVDGGLF